MKKHKTTYSLDVSWLKHFVEEVKDLIPIYKLKSVKGYKVRPNLEEKSYGSLTRHNINNYSMNIKMYTYDRTDRKYIKSPISMTLDTLAHELSHLKHWKHDINHYTLQVKILQRFIKIIKKLGITDTSMSITVEKR